MRRRLLRPQTEDNAWPALADTFTLLSGILLVMLLLQASKGVRPPPLPPPPPPPPPAEEEPSRAKKQCASQKDLPIDWRILVAQQALNALYNSFVEQKKKDPGYFAEPEQGPIYVLLPLGAQVPFEWGKYQVAKVEKDIKVHIAPVIKEALNVIRHDRAVQQLQTEPPSQQGSEDVSTPLDFIQLEISGHTDATPVAGCKLTERGCIQSRIAKHELLDNGDLSARRASAVAAVLLTALKQDSQIQSDPRIMKFLTQIHVAGYADNKPPRASQSDAASDRGKTQRRVEFRFMIDPYLLYEAQPPKVRP